MNYARARHIAGCGRVGGLGDLLSPIIVAAFTGQKVRFKHSLSLTRRLVAVGTVGQRQRLGQVDVWGSGFAGRHGENFKVARGWRMPPLTSITPHVTRGPHSAAMLRAAGIQTPDLHGDPAWLLPRIWPDPGHAPLHALGVFLHVSETADTHPDALARPEFLRYVVPTPFVGAVLVRPTHVAAEVGAVRARIEEMLSCRRILSTSLHALAIAEAYGIPCANFDFHPGPNGRFAPDDESHPLDHRMRDYYAGSGAKAVPVFRTERHMPTDWEAAIRFIDTHWTPLDYEPSTLLEAFPRALGQVSDMPSAGILARLDELADL
jgi:hypothetical protein